MVEFVQIDFYMCNGNYNLQNLSLPLEVDILICMDPLVLEYVMPLEQQKPVNKNEVDSS